jgi:hypothetical protein
MGASSTVPTCGQVGCCDDSKNKHATKHFRAVQHPIMTSLETGEDWSWVLYRRGGDVTRTLNRRVD